MTTYSTTNFYATATTSNASVYTAPIGGTAQIPSIRLANKSNGAVFVSVLVRSATAATSFYHICDLAMPSKMAVETVKGKPITLRSQDEIIIVASLANAVDVGGSVLEAHP